MSCTRSMKDRAYLDAFLWANDPISDAAVGKRGVVSCVKGQMVRHGKQSIS